MIAAEAASLGVGLRAALGSKGWAPVRMRPLSALVSTGCAPAVLVVEDDDGNAPKIVNLSEPGACVCVGSVRSLDQLIPLAERGSVVLNAATPFAVLVQLIDEALRGLRSKHPSDAESATRLRLRADERNALARLTAFESETLLAVMEGGTAAEIAEHTFRSVHTVRSHIKAVLSKLGVNSQAAAVAVAARSGFFVSVEARRAEFGGSVHRSVDPTAPGTNTRAARPAAVAWTQERCGAPGCLPHTERQTDRP